MSDLRPSLALLLLTILIGCDAGAGTPQAGAAAQAPTTPATPAVDACLTCHAGPMSFAGKDRAEVAQNLKKIVAGSKAHPPLGLSDESDAAIDALADQLTSKIP